MRCRRTYRATPVKRVDFQLVSEGRGPEEAQVGFDVGKVDVLAVVRWANGHFERPWLVKNPDEIKELVVLLMRLAAQRPLRLAMEPTGTYGDALRQALSDAGLRLNRVGAKAAHDYAEIFDGVPSQHDGKDAAVVAELAAIGKSVEWCYKPPSEVDQEMAYQVDWMDAQQRQYSMWLGRLEGLLARHWPEATRWMELSSATLLRALQRYGGPAGLAQRAGIDGTGATRRPLPGCGEDTRFDPKCGDEYGGTADDDRRATDAAVCRAGIDGTVGDCEESPPARRIGPRQFRDPGAGASCGSGNSLCVVGSPRRSEGVSLRGSVSQGDGSESCRAQQRYVPRQVADQQAWVFSGAAVAVLRRLAFGGPGPGAAMVSREEDQRRRTRETGIDRSDAQTGLGFVRSWRQWRILRCLAAVSWSRVAARQVAIRFAPNDEEKKQMK